jgi:hypothetical protein
MEIMRQVLKRIAKERDEQAIESQSKRGYWLVKTSDKSKHFVSETADIDALERVADKVLTDTDYEYTMAYCLGLDVKGAVAWSNNDHTHRFF